MTSPPFAPTSATCRIFPTTCASKPLRPSERSTRERANERSLLPEDFPVEILGVSPIARVSGDLLKKYAGRGNATCPPSGSVAADIDSSAQVVPATVFRHGASSRRHCPQQDHPGTGSHRAHR